MTDTNNKNCPKCGGLGKVETMVDCECVKPNNKYWEEIKRILMQYGVKVQHIMKIKEWHNKALEQQKKEFIEGLPKEKDIEDIPNEIWQSLTGAEQAKRGNIAYGYNQCLSDVKKIINE